MKFKSTYILGILVIIIAAYVYFVEILGEEKRLEAERLAELIFPFSDDDVYSMQIEKPDSTFSFEKRENEWFCKQPVEYKADNSKLNTLVTEFKNAKSEEEVVSTTDDPESFGLGTRGIKVTLTLKDGLSKTVELGDKNPIESNVYARTTDAGNVFMTSTSFYTNAALPFFDFRSKKILETDRSTINKLIINKGTEKFVVEKTETTDWNITSPVTEKADKSTINKILDNLVYDKIKEFTEEDPSELRQYGLDTAESVIEVFSGDAQDKSIINIGNITDGNYFVNTDKNKPIIKVDSTSVNGLFPDLFSIRDKNITDFNKETVDVMELNYPDAAYVFSKVDSSKTWIMTLPENKKASDTKITSLLNELGWLKAKSFIDSKGINRNNIGLNPPQADVTLRSKGNEILRVQLGKEIKESYYLFNVTKNQLFEVNASFKNQVVLKMEDLLEEGKN